MNAFSILAYAIYSGSLSINNGRIRQIDAILREKYSRAEEILEKSWPVVYYLA